METDPTPTLTSFDFSRAKSALSDLMTQVVHEHSPRVVSRHRGKEQMLLVRTDDLARYLSSFRFETEIALDEGEVTVALPALGLLGFGKTLDPSAMLETTTMFFGFLGFIAIASSDSLP